jgi:sugar/nucleoside kinase (ribokinase family)
VSATPRVAGSLLPRVRPRRLMLVGSVLVDVLMYVEGLPERGGDRVAQRSVLTTGGGLNVLVGAARLGVPVAYAGRVGDGVMGAQVTADLRAAGIPLMLPRVTGEDTGFDIGLVEPDGERTFVTAPGAEARLRPADLAVVPLQPGDAVYVSGYDLGYPISGAALGDWLPALSPDVLLVVDPGPLVAEIPPQRLERVLARADLFSLNAREAGILTHSADAREAAAGLVPRMAPGGWVVVRVGADGCWVAGAACPARHVAARQAQVVDTTGAGDAHIAALVARLAAGDDVLAAARAANIAASLAVERLGPGTGPTAQELDAARRQVMR